MSKEKSNRVYKEWYRGNSSHQVFIDVKSRSCRELQKEGTGVQPVGKSGCKVGEELVELFILKLGDVVELGVGPYSVRW